MNAVIGNIYHVSLIFGGRFCDEVDSSDDVPTVQDDGYPLKIARPVKARLPLLRKSTLGVNCEPSLGDLSDEQFGENCGS